jgi:GTP1/Obg family GTP-binding protein
MQEAQKALAFLQEACEKTRKEQQPVQDSYDVAKAHLDENGQPLRDSSTSAAQSFPGEQHPEQEDPEQMLIDVGDARTQYKEALNSFHKAEKHLRSCVKKQAAVEVSKGKGFSKGSAVEPHTAQSRRDALNRSQAHLQMLEEASQVLTQLRSPVVFV